MRPPSEQTTNPVTTPAPPNVQASPCECCEKTIGRRVNRFHCSHQGPCAAVCHKKQECSGIVRNAAIQLWLCTTHATPAPATTTPPPDTGQPPPVPTPSPANASRKCGKCKRPIRSNTTPIPCDVCTKAFHKSCTGLHPLSANAAAKGDQSWTCPSCEEKRSSRDESTQHGGTGEDVTDRSRKVEKNSLRILQWNADGLSTKIDELRERLSEDEYDICVIQETKLRRSNKSPNIKGYATLRADRKHQDGGGGLITYVKDTLSFEKIRDEIKDGTESSLFKVKMGKSKWIEICNVYCPPVRSHTTDRNIRLATETLPTSRDSISLGDFNAHSPIWDWHVPADDRGGVMEDWIINNDLTVLNDGRPTRINRARTAEDAPLPDVQAQPQNIRTGESSPDVSICGATWNGKCSWEPVECIGSSDHTPIAITIMSNVGHSSVFQGQAKWKSKDVDWKGWTEEVESRMNDIEEGDNITSRVHSFNTILTKAAEKFIGKVKPGKRTKSWFTPAVRTAIRKRNQHRHHVRTNRKEWIEACHEAQAEIRKAKEESWKDLLDDTINSADEAQMWRLIKSLNGSPDTNSPNEAMRHRGKVITNNKRKSDIFAQHYAAVSNLPMSKANRDTNRNLKKALRKRRQNKSPDDDAPDFTLAELRKAIKKMKAKGAPGPDDIPPSFLKNLGPIALDKLLGIFNLSFRSGSCPQEWRNAIIIPLLKAGKSASDLASFRPISLTSCVVKLLERLFAERLYHMAETKGWFSKLQAGFRKGRGCEDQILRLVQAIDDGFQHKPGKQSVLVLLDFSKAYDTVWRERLLLTMLEKGVPSIYVQWLFGFLQNRQARVRFNGVLSNSQKMRQGLPQGSVLAPILFLFYINELADLLPPDPTISMYADDVSILATARKLEEAERSAQQTVDIVVAWSKEWKLNLNASKSESSFFSRKPSDAAWSPTIRIGGRTINYEPYPRLLGVTLDRQLTFSTHTDIAIRKATAKLRMLGAIAHSEWGWRKQDLRKVYFSHIRSVLNFAGSAWQPWISNTNIGKLERTQNKALRLITGQAKSSPVDALRAEANIPSFESVITANYMRSWEKAHRLPENHPRRLAIASTVRQRLKRPNWRKKASELSALYIPAEDDQRKALTYFTTPPWQLGIGSAQVFPKLAGITGRNDNDQVKLDAALTRIREVDGTFTIYPDGSADAGTMDGGSGVIITTGDPALPTVLQTLTKKGAHFTSSYEEEAQALDMILDWIDASCSDADSVGIFTDSQSLCEALLGFNPDTDQLRSKLRSSKYAVTIQWIPGHSNIPGNELADKAAKEATDLPGPHRPTSYSSICTAIGLCTGDKPPEHERTREVYRCLSKEKEKTISSRSDQSLLAKIRSGHHIALMAYKHRIDATTDPMCPLCNEEEHSLEHWFTRCPATENERRRLFGEDSGKLECLTKFPKESVALARKTLGAMG